VVGDITFENYVTFPEPTVVSVRFKKFGLGLEP
jgi:hypothetical protein